MNLRPSRANLLTGLGIVLLLVLVVLAAPRWTRLLTRTVPGEEAAGDERREAHEDETPGVVQRQINVKLFFPSPQQPGLVMEERTVPFSSDLGAQLRAVVAELIQGSRSGLSPTMPPETKVLEVFVTARGVAYVDLSKEAGQGVAGSHDELLTVYSVVNSLTANFPAVKRVQILLEDRPAETLAGHIDLSRPLSADMTLLAAAAPPPGSGAPGPAASAPPGASPAPAAPPS